ncbi:cysteine hydrolase family protein [Sciscionella marina]|uniref:cysteine hydrolase family protein n=1 Tax=Sciscionella marina TaxID=508770 RepID=UPI00036B858C|nr:isochorismatase family cysteine hydrolase [Sciscionella marina]
MTDTIDPRHSALLVMDYQNGIIGSLPDAEALLERAAGAISLMRDRGGHIGYVRVAFTEEDFDRIPPSSIMAAMVTPERRAAMHAEAPATAVHERLAPEPGDIQVRKTRIGAFSTTDLDEQLRAREVHTLVLAGVATSGVVLSTVIEAVDRDYRVVLLTDACGDADPELHTLLTERMLGKRARLSSTTELPSLLG